jgi:tetratricopeptide (TPR) repeat protein
MVEQAITINPNLAACWQTMGSVSMYGGEHETAIEQLHRALRFNPVGPDSFHIEQTMSAAHFFLGQHEQALAWANKALAHVGNSAVALHLAASAHALLGDAGAARALVKHTLSLYPTMSVSTMRDQHPLKRPVDREKWASALRAAGFPE